MTEAIRPAGHYQGALAFEWCDYSKTLRTRPSNYLAADLSRVDASLWGREDEIGRLLAAAPAMLAALHSIANETSAWGECVGVAMDALQAIAQARGEG